MYGKIRQECCKVGKVVLKLCCAMLAVCCALTACLPTAHADPGQPMRDKYEVKTSFVSEATASKEYEELLAEYAQHGYISGADRLACDAWNDAAMQSNFHGYDGSAFAWRSHENSFSMDVTIENAGLYVLALDYRPYEDDIALIQRSVLIDGVSPSVASETCSFPRCWAEVSEPSRKSNGDEIAPAMQQLLFWHKQYLCDTNALYAAPLQFYLTKGTHTITLTDVSGTMDVGRLYVEPVPEYIPYETYRTAHAEGGYTGEPLYLEAETAAVRSERTIRRVHDADPACSPFDYNVRYLNTIGADRWQSGWQTITWVVDAPQDAYYRLDMRVLQNTGEGLTVYRQLRVDGEIPFAEAQALPFAYSKKWQTISLGQEEQPYELYLTQGRHEISLSVVSGEMSETIAELKRCSTDLSALLMDISTVVGSTPDVNFDYELENKIAWLLPTLTGIRDALEKQATRLYNLTGRPTTLVSNLYSSVEELDGYISKPETIPKASGSDGSLTVMQANLSTWYGDLLKAPMKVDTLALVSPEAEIISRSSSFWQKATATHINFVNSFTKDYNSIDSASSEKATQILKVWIARGREWGEALQRMCDDEFTPQTGIQVDINILPSGSVGVIGGVSPVLLSLVTGDAPHVVIGSDSSTPVELATKGSAVDLSKMAGYDDIAARFVPGAIEPLMYNGGVYALPETMDFQVMFYRKDIMEKLHLALPNTWDELYTRVLPTLKQNNYDFYLPITTSTTATYQYCAFYTYLYQRGGDIYTEDGLSTMLHSDASYAAFAQWVQNYTRYNMPYEINVFNHFRTGDIPLFVGGLNDYLTLKVAAPELYGKWGVTLLPGTVQKDGSINRSAIGALSTCMMFDKGEQANNASWAFLQWYMSDDVQYRYGEEIEAQVGLQARWFTANTAAFTRLPWESRDIPVFEEAMGWMRNPRNVLGGYITGRQLNNAWTRAVLNGQDEKEALEDAIREIEKELARKQIEYGVGGTK